VIDRAQLVADLTQLVVDATAGGEQHSQTDRGGSYEWLHGQHHRTNGLDLAIRSICAGFVFCVFEATFSPKREAH
jgi:hypothetical protein